MLAAQVDVDLAPAGAGTVLAQRVGVALRAMNGQLRTGADKGNPTV